MEAVLRRIQASSEPVGESALFFGDLKIDFAIRQVSLRGERVDLTPTEYDLLKELAQNAGKVMTHKMLLQRVWGSGYGDEMNYIRVFITRLRKKLGEDAKSAKYIENVPRVGYRFMLPA